MDLASSAPINKLQTGVREHNGGMDWVNLANCVGHCSQPIVFVSPSDERGFGEAGAQICRCSAQPGLGV